MTNTQGFGLNLSPGQQCDIQDAIASTLFDIAHDNGGLEGFQESNPNSTLADYINFATGEALTVALVHLKKYSHKTVREANGEFWGPLRERVAAAVDVQGGTTETAVAEAARDILLMVAQEYASELLA